MYIKMTEKLDSTGKVDIILKKERKTEKKTEKKTDRKKDRKKERKTKKIQ